MKLWEELRAQGCGAAPGQPGPTGDWQELAYCWDTAAIFPRAPPQPPLPTH